MNRYKVLTSSHGEQYVEALYFTPSGHDPRFTGDDVLRFYSSDMGPDCLTAAFASGEWVCVKKVTDDE